MTLFLAIIAFVIIFSLLILIHEFGHFWVAKKCGIKVEEFGMGMPPKIWGFKPKNSETTYSLNAIPFGGFVRLYGEDSHDEKALKSNRSYVGKPPWMKILVVIAGVCMNFLLAFVLLYTGLVIGMQPLFVSSEDVFQGINDGVIQVEQGLMIKEVTAGLNMPLMAGDKLLSVNNKPILLGDEVSSLKDQEMVEMEVLRSGVKTVVKFKNDQKNPGFKLYDSISLPKIVVQSVIPGQRLFQVGLRNGDVIQELNGRKLFTEEEFVQALAGQEKLTFKVVRGDVIQDYNIPVAAISGLAITGVLPDSSAEKADLRVGDIIVKLEDETVGNPKDLAGLMAKYKDKDRLKYSVIRSNSNLEFFVDKGSNGYIGVLLSELRTTGLDSFQYYQTSQVSSVLKINDVRYSWSDAFGKTLSEMGRLSEVTVKTFGALFQQVFTKFSVPEGVAGPVGIAQMTYTFVQEGFISLLRFAALLSLSLAIINILPFPGLDGGRLFLIVLSVLIGKKLPAKVEGTIHIIGFLVLMLLIGIITFHDIFRIFS